MKTRQGFVSNSSSSSFILYGARMSHTDITDLLVLKNAEKFKELSGCDDQQAACEKYEEDWGGDLAVVFNAICPDVEIDDYPDEEGQYMVGLQTDPECFDISDVVNGIWTQEQVDFIDKFFEGTDTCPCLDAGTKYC